jgi:hypothetical protein
VILKYVRDRVLFFTAITLLTFFTAVDKNWVPFILGANGPRAVNSIVGKISGETSRNVLQSN